MPRQGRFIRSVSKFAIPHITAYWIMFQVVCMLLIWMKPEFARQIVFSPELVMQGEWWRVITFLIMPASTDPLFAVFVYYFYWMMGNALEGQWGTANYNFFLLIGAAMNVAAGFIPYFVLGHGGVSTNIFLLESVFLSFAVFYPEFVIYIFFVLPVKIKWLAMLTCILYTVQFFVSDWTGKAMIVASLANFFIFFSKDIVRNFKLGGRHLAKQIKVVPEAKDKPLHQCSVCAITEKTAPDAEFRYCEKCGGKCYCLVHLKDHVCAAAAAAN